MISPKRIKFQSVRQHVFSNSSWSLLSQRGQSCRRTRAVLLLWHGVRCHRMHRPTVRGHRNLTWRSSRSTQQRSNIACFKAIFPHVDKRLLRFKFQGNAVTRLRFNFGVDEVGAWTHRHSDGIWLREGDGCLREKILTTSGVLNDKELPRCWGPVKVLLFECSTSRAGPARFCSQGVTFCGGNSFPCLCDVRGIRWHALQSCCDTLRSERIISLLMLLRPTATVCPVSLVYFERRSWTWRGFAWRLRLHRDRRCPDHFILKDMDHHLRRDCRRATPPTTSPPPSPHRCVGLWVRAQCISVRRVSSMMLTSRHRPSVRKSMLLISLQCSGRISLMDES